MILYGADILKRIRAHRIGTLSWAVQQRLNWSRCSLGCWVRWTKEAWIRQSPDRSWARAILRGKGQPVVKYRDLVISCAKNRWTDRDAVFTVANTPHTYMDMYKYIQTYRDRQTDRQTDGRTHELTSLQPLKKVWSEMGSLRNERSRFDLKPFGGSFVIFTPGQYTHTPSLHTRTPVKTHTWTPTRYICTPMHQYTCAPVQHISVHLCAPMIHLCTPDQLTSTPPDWLQQ